MDDPSQKGRRSSILKLRQGDVTVENTDDVDDEQKQVFKRRVSFHNVKTVQTFDENNLNLLDGSPVKEKIQETMSSDGVLTPGRGHIPSLTHPSKADERENVENTSSMDITMNDSVTGLVPGLCRHEKTRYSTCDMSLGNETFLNMEGDLSPPADDQTEDMSISSNRTTADLPGLTPTVSRTSFEESNCETVFSFYSNSFLSQSYAGFTPSSDFLIAGTDFSYDNLVSTHLYPVHRHLSLCSENKTTTFPPGDNTSLFFKTVLHRNQKEEDVDTFCLKSAQLSDATDFFREEPPKPGSEDMRSSCDRSGQPQTGSRMDISTMDVTITTSQNIQNQVIGETSESCADVDKMAFSVQSVQPEDGNDLVRENIQDSVIRMEEEEIENADTAEKNYSQLYYSTNETHNEVSITKRDISVMPVGSRFQLSSSSKDDSTLSGQSLHETASYLKRMMFNTQSMQVNYVSPANNQPESNRFREEILEELRRKVLEIEASSSSNIDILLPKLQEIHPKKAQALKKMDMRALELDDVDVFHCACLRSEIEWAQFRLEIAQKARSALQQSLANDEPKLQTCREDAQLCCSRDELQRDVEKLQTELADLPSADEIAAIIASHKQAVEEEEDLEDQILDLELKEMRMDAELAIAKNKEYKEIVKKLNDMAKTCLKNRERIRAFTAAN
ncbi:hypothetical protein KIN20_009742 [Parelaphostrongylus tenuis]|uniref:Uncharacterized protein n=1 Tax=Parelaphostrongylus tenuis TaxID=148309 RepID=A0AAD5QLG6_PARTN|nr:hypothetical protein KIN20_009742 [Parelaphostrongylus tenuis]